MSEILALRQDQQTLVDPMLRLHSDEAFEIIQCAVIRHALIIDPHPTTIAGTISHFLFDLSKDPGELNELSRDRDKFAPMKTAFDDKVASLRMLHTDPAPYIAR